MAGILLLPLWVCAQGVNFRPLSYTEAIELAAKENKMVFIDFYTTWCGPCKRMSKEVFSQQEVGEYFNRTFISLKLDAEKENGLELAKKYAVLLSWLMIMPRYYWNKGRQMRDSG